MRRIASTLGVLATLGVACGDCGDDSALDGAVGDGAVGDGNTCQGVSCDDPPPPFCVGEDTLRQLGGRCVDGQCIYDQVEDSTCGDCCYGAEINLTGEPLGGGVGYSEIFSPGEATVVVSTAADLLTALAAATDGEIIYLTDTAEIDLGGESYVEIPAGVTLASGRGRDGSSGALIFSDSFQYPLFRTLGDGVRLTGLRLRGPNHDIGDHDYALVPHSGAISTGYVDFEVDNSELWDWGTSAISLGTGAEGHVHHNYIHHTRRAGLGYGVVLNQSYALIEGNVFDACRHHIAATGRYGTSYEAAYNLVLEHAHSHYYDMHGARDFDKYHTKAIWRFDEGSGDQARDSSIGYYHNLNHCTLGNMNLGEVWVPGWINTGLDFDGDDDRLDCGNDESLLSPEGTIYFWMKPAALGQDAVILKLFEDQSANYLSIAVQSSNQIRLLIEDGNSALTDFLSSDTIPDTDFHHVAVTQDGAGAKIYIDGVESAVAGTNSTAWSGHLSLTGSRVGGGHASFFEGILDEVRIYDRSMDAGEVDQHFQGNADIAGNVMRIHHNTFRGVEQSAIVIRGRPAEGAWIEKNWFHSNDPAQAIRQINAEGNLHVSDNHHGTTIPLGTVLPTLAASADPSFGTAPLTIAFDGSESFDPGGELVAHQWEFGDGAGDDEAQSSHTYGEPGSYLAKLTVFDENGVRAKQLVPVSAAPVGVDHLLDFWVEDSYSGPLTDFYRKQALVDGVLVWEDDVAGNEGWTHVSVDVSALLVGKELAEVVLRVQNINPVVDELIEIDVFWDDVELFGGTVSGGDFERAAGWSYSESGATSWSGRHLAAEPHTGDRSYRISHPYKTACPGGSRAQISQLVPIKSPDLLAEWRFDEGEGDSARDDSLYGNHATLVDMDAASWVAGVMSHGLSFAGADDRAECSSPTSLASAQGSIVLWLNASPVTEPQVLFEVFQGTGESSLSLGLTTANRLRLLVRDGGTTRVDLTANPVVADGEFHHVAVTQNGSGVLLYVDGVEAATSGTDGNYFTDHFTPDGVWLGAGHDGGFAGALDELRVYAYALDAAAIAEDHGKGYLLAHWPFDEGSGSDAGDATGNGNDGVLENMNLATCWVGGEVGMALLFDGDDDQVSCGTNLVSSEGTIELWVKPALFDINQDLINVFEDGYQNFLLIRRDSANRILVLIEDDDAAQVSLTTAALPQDEEFHHVAVTQDGLGVKIYVDGVPGGTGLNSSYWIDHLTLAGFWIGGGHWSNFNGVLDEVKVYPRALRPHEIAQHAGL